MSPPSERSSQSTVHVRGLTRVFDGRTGTVTALEDVNLDVGQGEFVSILGPSGCGKSTLLSLIAGLDQPTAGSVVIGEEQVRGPYTKCGIVFQRDLLLEWRTAVQNILLQFELRGEKASAHEPRAVELLKLVGIDEFRDHYPRQLSGGMRQRVSICRALAHHPELLLMDEPFGALDALTRDQLNDELASISAHAGTTVVFITHSISEAVFLGDRVVVMSPRPGRIVREVAVELPRPRSRTLRTRPEFSEYVRELRGILDELAMDGAAR